MSRPRSLSSVETKKLSEDKKKFLSNQSAFVPGSEEIEGQTKPIRNQKHLERLVSIDPEILEVNTLWAALTNTVSKHGERRSFGVRDKEQGYQWITYKQFKERVLNFASGMLSLGLKPKETRVGIYSKNRLEWVITEYASNSQTMPTVAIYDTFGPSVIEFIINHAELPIIITSADGTKKILNASANCPSLKFIVQMEPLSEEIKKEAQNYKVELFSFEEIEEKGKKVPSEPHPPEPSDLAVIMYTR